MADLVDLFDHNNPKQYRPIYDPLSDLNDEELLRRYRFDSQGIEFLCDLVRDQLRILYYKFFQSESLLVQTIPF